MVLYVEWQRGVCVCVLSSVTEADSSLLFSWLVCVASEGWRSDGRGVGSPLIGPIEASCRASVSLGPNALWCWRAPRLRVTALWCNAAAERRAHRCGT